MWTHVWDSGSCAPKQKVSAEKFSPVCTSISKLGRYFKDEYQQPSYVEDHYLSIKFWVFQRVISVFTFQFKWVFIQANIFQRSSKLSEWEPPPLSIRLIFLIIFVIVLLLMFSLFRKSSLVIGTEISILKNVEKMHNFSRRMRRHRNLLFYIKDASRSVCLKTKNGSPEKLPSSISFCVNIIRNLPHKCVGIASPQ